MKAPGLAGEEEGEALAAGPGREGDDAAGAAGLALITLPLASMMPRGGGGAPAAVEGRGGPDGAGPRPKFDCHRIAVDKSGLASAFTASCRPFATSAMCAAFETAFRSILRAFLFANASRAT